MDRVEPKHDRLVQWAVINRVACILLFSTLCIGCKSDSDQSDPAPATTDASISAPSIATSSAVSETDPGPPGCCTFEDNGTRICDQCEIDASIAQYCVAFRQPDREPYSSEYTCQAVCIHINEEEFYCGDDSSCCDPNAYCDQATGFCIEGTGTTAAGTSTGDGTSTGGGTTTGTGSSTGATSSGGDTAGSDTAGVR